MIKTENYIPRVLLILVIIFLISLQEERILGFSYFNPNEDKLKVQEITITDTKNIFPDADQIYNNGEIIKVFNNQNTLIGNLISSSPYTNKIVGYSGNVPLIIGISLTDSVKGVQLLKNYESPEYLNHIHENKLLNSWNNQSTLGAIELEIDAVSGATETSEAIIKSVRHRLSLYKNLDVEKSGYKFFIEFDFLISLVLLFFAVLSFYFPKKYRKYRILLLVSNIVVWGIWQGKFISVFLLKSWLINGIPVISKIIIFSLVLLTFIFQLFNKKNFYCNYVCPFGSLQEILSKNGIFKYQIGKKAKSALNIIGLIILAVILLTLITGISFDLSLIEPFSFFNFKSASYITIIIASIILIASIFFDRPWCRFLCPTGKLIKSLNINSNKP